MSAYTDIYIYIHMLTYTTDVYRHRPSRDLNIQKKEKTGPR